MTTYNAYKWEYKMSQNHKLEKASEKTQWDFLYTTRATNSMRNLIWLSEDEF